MKSPKEKYENDPAYRQLVDALEAVINHAQLTPSEVRECAVLASIHYELRYGFRHYTVPLPIKDAIDKLREWSELKPKPPAGAGPGLPERGPAS